MKPTQKFYKMPQALFSDKYTQLSNDAKILYMLLLDRRSLSEKNHFNDENGNAVTIRRPNCFESWKAQIYCEGTDKVKANRV